MTIQATFTTLTLTVSLISGSWTLASDEPTAEQLADAVPVQLEAQPLVLPGAEPLAWRRIQLQAMQQDFGWARSAAQYLSLYRELAGKAAGAPWDEECRSRWACGRRFWSI